MATEDGCPRQDKLMIITALAQQVLVSWSPWRVHRAVQNACGCVLGTARIGVQLRGRALGVRACKLLGIMGCKVALRPCSCTLHPSSFVERELVNLRKTLHECIFTMLFNGHAGARLCLYNITSCFFTILMKAQECP